MASSGDSIKYSNFSTSYSGDLRMDIDSGSGVGHRYVYVSSSSWWAQITINKNWGSWGRSFTFTASYWNGSRWIQAWSDTHSWGQFESGQWNYKYYHNSTLGTTSGDKTDPVLWELHFYYPELYRKRLWVYAGGAGCMGESLYNSLYKNNKIYSAGRLGEDSRWDYASTESRNSALSVFSQSANTGTKITAANEAKLVRYKYC